MSDAVVVAFDGTNYCGSSTLAEIQFANYLQLPVFYFRDDRFTSHSKDILSPPKHNNYKDIESFILLNNGLGF